MPRPRADGRPARSAVRTGKERTNASGRKWRTRIYAPTDGAPNGRVVYLSPDTGKLTSKVPGTDETLDSVFDQIEKWLDQGVALGRTATGDVSPVTGSGRRDMAALGALYLQDLTEKGLSPDYIANRRCLIGKWITPVVGTMLVSDWGALASTRIITNARPHLSASRLNDLGSTLSGLRGTAHSKRPGGRWLSPDDNPLEKVAYGKATTRQGASSKWVPPHKRPSTEMVHKAIVVAEQVGRWDWMPLAIRVCAFSAPRQGEMLALRAVDVDFAKDELDVNGAWTTPSSGKRAGRGKTRTGHRKPHTKNGKRRTTPYLGSQREPLRQRVAAVLGMPDSTPVENLIVLIDAERQRRAALTATGDWRDAEVPPADEMWLFPVEGGVPPTKEQFNAAWHVVRDAVGWNRAIPFKNLRHHAVLWWKANVPDITWETIADWDGHDVRTLMGYYIIASEDATVRARPHLDQL